MNIIFINIFLQILFSSINSQQILPNNNSTICNSKICDEIGGYCKSEGYNYICQCKDEYTTLMINNINSTYKFCNYEKKRALYASLLELFLGFGTGHFYALRKINGYFKLFLSTICCWIGCCSLMLGLKASNDVSQETFNREDLSKFFMCIYACIFNTFLIWQIIDFFLFIFRFYNDGNSITLI